MSRRTCFSLLLISVFALIMVNDYSGLKTSANIEPSLKQSVEFVNGETPVLRLNQLNDDVAIRLTMEEATGLS